MKVKTARFIRSVRDEDDLPAQTQPEIAFAGRSNVGKSTLLNRLVGRKALARVSSSPGRTRAINFFLIDSRFHFVDLPGYGFARVSKRERRSWAALMERYFQRSAGRSLVIHLVDAKAGATPLDHQANDYLRALGCEPLIVATKIDRVAKSRRRAVLEAIGGALGGGTGGGPVAFSARTGEGVKDLWREIGTYLRTFEETAS